MEEKIPKSQLRKIYVSILHGFSVVVDERFGTLYLKHLDLFESQEMDEKNEFYTELAKKKGLPTEKERTEEIIKNGDWSPKKDSEIEESQIFIKNLEATKSKMFLQSEIKKLSEEIKKTKNKINELSSEKSDLIGVTAESYAAKKINDYYIFNTLYKDRDLKNKKFGPEEFDYLDEMDVLSLARIYNENIRKVSETTLKRIALSGFFLNNYTLSKDNPFIFYGKPITSLTFYQSDLFSFGRYFKHILSEMKNPPSQEEMEDPDKLIDKFNISKNSEEVLSKSKSREGAATTIVGATKEDLKALGLASGEKTGEVIDLNKEAAKKGGSLSMQDLMKLHGV
jgi:hypothetical protein